MTRATKDAPTAMRRAFTLAVAAYLAAWAAVYLFVSRAFGAGAALWLSVILAFPFAVAVRLRGQWPAVRGRELAWLLILVVFATGAVVGLVGNWYDNGIHRRHAEDVEFAEFEDVLRRDPAFRHVELWQGKGFAMMGTVASDADLARLESLASRCRLIHWGEDLEVIGSRKRVEVDGNGRRETPF